MSFELKLYDLPLAWIDQTLDALCVRHMRDWMEVPISSCVREMSKLPTSLAGLGIMSLRDTEKMRVIKRHALRGSQNKDMGHLFIETSSKHVDTDSIVTSIPSRRSALSSLKKNQKSVAWLHMLSLPVQGASIAIIKEAVPKQSITLWSKYMARSSAVIHNFTRKAPQSQIPTAANLKLWERIDSPNCPLCGGTRSQTNKHVLSNCSSPIALNRYRGRHDSVLVLIARWLQSV